MKNKTFSFLAVLLISTGVMAQEKSVKMSNSGICHAFNTTHHEQTKKFTPYKTLDESLKALVFMLKKAI